MSKHGLSLVIILGFLVTAVVIYDFLRSDCTFLDRIFQRCLKVSYPNAPQPKIVEYEPQGKDPCPREVSCPYPRLCLRHYPDETTFETEDGQPVQATSCSQMCGTGYEGCRGPLQGQLNNEPYNACCSLPKWIPAFKDNKVFCYKDQPG